jgi:hypothetical protein
MALIDDVLKAGPVPLLGLGVVALAVPFFFPALRPQLEAVFKSGAKLFLEAELGADDAIADRFVNAAVDALFHATAHGTDEERKQKAESQINRFVSRAHAGSRRRGWDEQDAERRYHRRLRKLDHAIERARHRAGPRQRAALAHASESLERHRPKPKQPSPPMLEQPAPHPQPARIAGQKPSVGRNT